MRVRDLRKYLGQRVELRWEDAELESGVDDLKGMALPVWKSLGWLLVVGRDLVALAPSVPEHGEPRGLEMLKMRPSWVKSVIELKPIEGI